MLIHSPYLPAIKSAGGLTFAKWKGLHTARARIFANASRTIKQIFQRERFKFVQTLAMFWGKTAVNFFWKQWEENTTASNELMHTNVPLQPTFVDPETPFSGNAADFMIMRGDLEKIDFVGNAEYTPATGEVAVIWDPAVKGNGLSTDKVYFLVLDGDANMAATEETKTRADASAAVTVGKDGDGASVTAFLGLFRELTDGSIRTANGVGKDVTAV